MKADYLLVDMCPRLLHRVQTTSFSTRAPRRREPGPPPAAEDDDKEDEEEEEEEEEAPSPRLCLAAAAANALGSSVRREPPAVPVPVAARRLTAEGAMAMPPACGPDESAIDRAILIEHIFCLETK